MSIHQQINPNTVDPANLPDHLTANAVMDKVSKMLWDVDNRESYTTFHDYWASSTNRTGVRTLRVRHKYNDAVNAVMPAIRELLAPYEGMYKTYLYGRYFMQGDTGYDVHTGRAMCIMLYYRSWKSGEPRRKQIPDPGYALTFHKGDRIEYQYDDVWFKATVLQRGTSLSRRPHYKIRTDEVLREPYNGTIEDVPERQRAWFYETYAMQPDVRALIS